MKSIKNSSFSSAVLLKLLHLYKHLGPGCRLSQITWAINLKQLVQIYFIICKICNNHPQFRYKTRIVNNITRVLLFLIFFFYLNPPVSPKQCPLKTKATTSTTFSPQVSWCMKLWESTLNIPHSRRNLWRKTTKKFTKKETVLEQSKRLVHFKESCALLHSILPVCVDPRNNCTAWVWGYENLSPMGRGGNKTQRRNYINAKQKTCPLQKEACFGLHKGNILLKVVSPHLLWLGSFCCPCTYSMPKSYFQQHFSFSETLENSRTLDIKLLKVQTPEVV